MGGGGLRKFEAYNPEVTRVGYALNQVTNVRSNKCKVFFLTNFLGRSNKPDIFWFNMYIFYFG